MIKIKLSLFFSFGRPLNCVDVIYVYVSSAQSQAERQGLRESTSKFLLEHAISLFFIISLFKTFSLYWKLTLKFWSLTLLLLVPNKELFQQIWMHGKFQLCSASDMCTHSRGIQVLLFLWWIQDGDWEAWEGFVSFNETQRFALCRNSIEMVNNIGIKGGPYYPISTMSWF